MMLICTDWIYAFAQYDAYNYSHSFTHKLLQCDDMRHQTTQWDFRMHVLGVVYLYNIGGYSTSADICVWGLAHAHHRHYYRRQLGRRYENQKLEVDNVWCVWLGGCVSWPITTAALAHTCTQWTTFLCFQLDNNSSINEYTNSTITATTTTTTTATTTATAINIKTTSSGMPQHLYQSPHYDLFH